MANLIVFRNGMIDASTIHYAECSSGLFIVSRKDGLSSVRLTPEQFEDLSEQIKRQYSTETTKSAESTKSAETDNTLKVDQLQKDNEDLETCLVNIRGLRLRNLELQQERDANVPKLEHAMVLISTIGAERDALKAQNNALSDEIAELKKRIIGATEVISDLVSK